VSGCAGVPWCTAEKVLAEGCGTFQGKGKESSIGVMYSSDYARMLPIGLMAKGTDQSRRSVSCLCFMRGSV